METSSWINNIIGISAIVIPTLVTILIFFKQKKKKELSYYILSDYKLIEAGSNYNERLKIFFDEYPVVNPNILILKFKNTGNISIERQDFNTPIKIDFGTKGKLLTLQVNDKYPSDVEVSLEETSSSSINVSLGLLNKGDYFSLSLLFDEEVKYVKPCGRISGIKEIKEGKVGAEIKNWIFPLLALIGTVVVCIFFIFWMYRFFIAPFPGLANFLLIFFIPFLLIIMLLLLSKYLIGTSDNHT